MVLPRDRLRRGTRTQSPTHELRGARLLPRFLYLSSAALPLLCRLEPTINKINKKIVVVVVVVGAGLSSNKIKQNKRLSFISTSSAPHRRVVHNTTTTWQYEGDVDVDAMLLFLEIRYFLDTCNLNRHVNAALSLC